MGAWILDKLAKFHIGMKGSFHSLSFTLRQKHYLSKKIVACVFSVGERTEDLSLASIREQTIPLSRIEIIKNINPISEASNRVFDVAKDADYVLWVDADMVLFSNCVHHLLRLAHPKALFSVGRLHDPVFGKIGYIKLLNMELAQRLGIRFRDVLGCDIDFCRQARQKDPGVITDTYTLMRRVLGIHHPTYTPKELFKKTQIHRKKNNNRIDMSLLKYLLRQYRATGNNVLLAGIVGTVLPNPDSTPGESTSRSGEDNWALIETLLGNQSLEQVYGFAGQDLQIK